MSVIHIVCRDCTFEELTRSEEIAAALQSDRESNLSHHVVYQEVAGDV